MPSVAGTMHNRGLPSCFKRLEGRGFDRKVFTCLAEQRGKRGGSGPCFSPRAALLVAAKAAHTLAARTLAMDRALLKFPAGVAGAAEHVEKVARGQMDVVDVEPVQVEPVWRLQRCKANCVR